MKVLAVIGVFVLLGLLNKAIDFISRSSDLVFVLVALGVLLALVSYLWVRLGEEL